ncbi:hypothetical protein SCHIN_v1c02080 [Spiroplasma chinense]|uniref:Putative Se/S carrier protein-like domain-containing protein n=1 Tax=Spiroplasma chinense TaxID=216932 RepID=A0A5B9Y3N2_9MOLU|nr:putative Se/S carrier-like protein [Spiroplasma chinense]QEH61405.1 hypothetical protein SCHIN_v1c02080 [Spiroplasma chinense]
MRLVSQYKYIITFKNGIDSKNAKAYCQEKEIDFMYFPTPVVIDSGCGWCVGFANKDLLNLTLKKINIDYEEIYERKENNLWVKM